MILSVHRDRRNDELTTALGEKADAPDTKARESRSFMVIICVLLDERCVRLLVDAEGKLKSSCVEASITGRSTYASRHIDGQLLLEL